MAPPERANQSGTASVLPPVPTVSSSRVRINCEPACKAVLYSAPPIPAGIHRNPQESSGMAPESAGILRNPQESTGMGITESSGMTVHANVCI